MNKKIVSDWAKKNFLHWFVENHQFESAGPKQVLLELAGNEFLSKIHIILDGSNSRPLLVISTEGTGMPSVLLKNHDNATISDSQAILSQLQLFKESPLYLTLYFSDRATCEPHQAVIEEIAMPVDESATQQVLIDFELSLWRETIQHEMNRARLMSQIDQALDEGNKQKFRRLVKKLKNL
jgi:uncharacterized protein YpiB (UPF0302 family)